MQFNTDLPGQPEPIERPRLSDRRSFLREAVETLLLIIGIYTLVNLATARFVVEGRSMYPSFLGEEYLIVSRLSYIVGDPDRGDVVVFHYPEDPSRDFIKRVIGLPGETVHIENGQIYINNVPISEPYIAELCETSMCQNRTWTLGDDEFFVMGDNRNASQDSRSFGAINRSHIIGRALVIYWPPSEWGIINHHDYGSPPANVPPPSTSPTPMPAVTEPPMFDSTGG